MTHDTEAWIEQTKRDRESKEEYFGESPRSPLPPEIQGEQFPGLAYYEINPEYRYILELDEHEQKETVTVETTAEGEQTYLRWGEFRFEIDGRRALQAYRPDRDADRHIDLEDNEHLIDDGWILDLNQAYNPTCAYNHAYECPLIPRENWLEVRVEAGEKDFPAEPADPHRGHGHGD